MRQGGDGGGGDNGSGGLQHSSTDALPAAPGWACRVDLRATAVQGPPRPARPDLLPRSPWCAPRRAACPPWLLRLCRVERGTNGSLHCAAADGPATSQLRALSAADASAGAPRLSRQLSRVLACSQNRLSSAPAGERGSEGVLSCAPIQRAPAWQAVLAVLARTLGERWARATRRSPEPCLGARCTPPAL